MADINNEEELGNYIDELYDRANEMVQAVAKQKEALELIKAQEREAQERLEREREERELEEQERASQGVDSSVYEFIQKQTEVNAATSEVDRQMQQLLEEVAKINVDSLTKIESKLDAVDKSIENLSSNLSNISVNVETNETDETDEVDATSLEEIKAQLESINKQLTDIKMSGSQNSKEIIDKVKKVWDLVKGLKPMIVIGIVISLLAAAASILNILM